MPRGWISRLKNTTTLKFDHDLPVAVGILGDCIQTKTYFPTGSIFFRIYKLVGFFLEKI